MPGYDDIHGYWFKKVNSIYDRLVFEINTCLQDTTMCKCKKKKKKDNIDQNKTPKRYLL